ncbi:MAG: hypothetical protein HY078_07095 [Elusimicrobia bacterium]|nr:hypothetical protein [Elusimicrobiota bacterium]
MDRSIKEKGAQRSGTFELRVSVSRSHLRAGLAALLLCCGVLELSSETMTLTTYYPSPLGVYKSLTSTQQATFARDGGNVGIGTATPDHKLQVRGGAAADDFCLNDGSACLSKTKKTSAMASTAVPIAWAGGGGSCESGFSCTDWIDIPNSDPGPLKLQSESSVILTFNGNYNCNYCDASDRSYTQARILASKDGGPYADVYTGRAIFVENAGTDFTKRAVATLGAGTYRFKLQHKLSVYHPDPSYNIWLTEGLFTVER